MAPAGELGRPAVAGSDAPAPAAVELVKPGSAVAAVDHALLALDLLTRRRTVRVTDLAVDLGVGRATAHRLLQTMVYRGFAVQNPDRSYAAGPALFRAHRREQTHDLRHLRTQIRPRMEDVHARLLETVHLKVLIGIEAVCLDSIEGVRPLHTPGARGMRYPAEHVSGGLALLAALPEVDLRRRFAGRPHESMLSLERTLVTTRQRGFGLIVGEGQAGITSVAAVIFDGDGIAVAALSAAAPRLRMNRAQTLRTAEVLRAAADAARESIWPADPPPDAHVERSR